ncbi:MAG: 2-phospho-L-lactate transferase CofD family protein [Asgard group archaeon]
MSVVVLSGGHSNITLLRGLSLSVPFEEFVVVVNPLLDHDFGGIRCSPDILHITRAFCVHPALEIFFLDAVLNELGLERGYPLSDFEIACSMYIHHFIKKGKKLSQIYKDLNEILNIDINTIPLTEDVEARAFVEVGSVKIPLERFLHLSEVMFSEGDSLKIDIRPKDFELNDGVIKLIKNAEALIMAPLSSAYFLLILSIKPLVEAIQSVEGQVVCVTPHLQGILNQKSMPFFSNLNVPSGLEGLAKLLEGVADTLIIDKSESDNVRTIAKLFDVAPGLEIIDYELYNYPRKDAKSFSNFVLKLTPAYRYVSLTEEPLDEKELPDAMFKVTISLDEIDVTNEFDEDTRIVLKFGRVFTDQLEAFSKSQILEALYKEFNDVEKANNAFKKALKTKYIKLVGEATD